MAAVRHKAVLIYLNDSCNVTLTDQERRELLLAMGIMGAVSAVFCLVALLLVFCLKLYKHFCHRLAAYQVISSFFFSVVCSVQMIMIDYDRDPGLYEPVCEALGCLLEYTVWVKMLAMLWLTFHLFSFTVCYASLRRAEIVCALIVILSPLLFVWIPFANGAYGIAGAWCWIKNWNGDCMSSKFPVGEIEQYGLMYVPAFMSLVGAVLLIAIMIIVMLCRLKTSPSLELQPLVSDTKRKRALKELLPLVAYPVLFCLFLFPPFINRVYSDIGKANMATFMASSVTIAALGLFASLTLILHVLVLKWPRASSSTTVYGPDVNGDKTIQSGRCGCVSQCTSRAICSTNCRTYFSIPNESEVDDALLGTANMTSTDSS